MRFFFPLSLFRLVLVWYWHWWHGLWKFYDIKYFNIIKTFLKEKKTLYHDIKFVILWYKILVISPTPTSDDASYIRFGETKDKYFKQSLRHGTEMRHRNLRSDSVLVHTSYIGTGALLVPGFSTQSYRRLAHFGPVGRWASISQIHAPQPLREPRTQGKFCQERAVPQPTNFVPGNSYRLSPHECGSHARTCTGHSAAHGFIRTRSPSPSQSVSKDAVPHGLTVFGTQVGPASHAAPSVLAETSSSSSYLASRTPPCQGEPGLRCSYGPLEKPLVDGIGCAPGQTEPGSRWSVVSIGNVLGTEQKRNRTTSKATTRTAQNMGFKYNPN